MNDQIRNFRDSILELINQSGLPIEVVRLVFLEVHNALNAECERIISEERKTKTEGENK